MPASSAAWIVRMLSSSSLCPYAPDMPMQPRPRTLTVGPVLPRVVVAIVMSPTMTHATTAQQAQVLPGTGSPWLFAPPRAKVGGMDRAALADLLRSRRERLDP